MKPMLTVVLISLMALIGVNSIQAQSPSASERMAATAMTQWQNSWSTDPARPERWSYEQGVLLKIFSTITGVIAMIGFVITGLSLFVGGIGIMNIMYVSVTERTREIGIRKALGARRRTILFQFLVEAAAICLLGGLIGLALAYPCSILANQIIPTAMPLGVVFLAIVISLAVGVISGFLQANKASKLDPVDALRYE